jgi:hypothetical protein
MKNALLRAPLFARILTMVVVAAGVALATALPAGADVQVQSPPVADIRVQSPATLSARGAVATVPVLVVCARGETFAQVQVSITQRVAGGDIARGSGGSQVACRGYLVTVNVAVTAQNRAFRPAVAFASGSFTVCDNSGCREARDEREIQIVR